MNLKVKKDGNILEIRWTSPAGSKFVSYSRPFNGNFITYETTSDYADDLHYTEYMNEDMEFCDVCAPILRKESKTLKAQGA